MVFTVHLFLFFILFSNAAAEPTGEKIETKLDKLNEELLGFKNFLSSTEEKSSEAERQLRSSEKELSVLINNIEKKKNR